MRLGVSVVAALIIGVAADPGGAPAAQEPRFPCDADRDGAVSAEAAPGRERARPGVDGRAAATLDADGLREQFAQADEDGDGRISREEWLRSFGPAHAGTTEGAAGRPVGSD